MKKYAKLYLTVVTFKEDTIFTTASTETELFDPQDSKDVLFDASEF